jgi:hypothetical protein
MTGTLHQEQYTVFIYLAEFYTEWEMFQTKFVRKNQNKHFSFNNIFIFENGAVLWDNVEKYYRAVQATDDHIILHMRIACWIPKATNTPSEYVYCFPLQKCLYERAPMLRYTYIACLLLLL